MAIGMLDELERRFGLLDEARARVALLVATRSPPVLTRLVRRFGSGRAALAQAEASEVSDMDPHALCACVEQELALIDSHSAGLLIPGDEKWPAILDTAVRPPALLYVKGTLPDLSRRVPLALVGSRACTDYGRRVARSMASLWASCGGVVVSGGALGIDSAAHEGSLDGGGPAAAVLGSGLHKFYPHTNAALFQRIVENGALLSELPMTAGSLPFSFPERNRIIAGLSRAVVLVQARRGSGALYTAGFSLQCARPLFAVPGPVDEEACAGGLELLAQGVPAMTGLPRLAALYAELSGRPAAPAPGLPLVSARPVVQLDGLDPGTRLTLEHLGQGEAHVDDLRSVVGLEAGALSLLLLELEMRGWVEKGAGNHYSSRVRLER